jgi:hypothetical protein
VVNGPWGPSLLRGDQGGGDLLGMHNTGGNPQGCGLSRIKSKTNDPKSEKKQSKAFHVPIPAVDEGHYFYKAMAVFPIDGRG